nr:hypothetical protein [Comamonas testosteroni]
MTAVVRVILNEAIISIFESSALGAIDLKAWIASQNYFINSDISQDNFSLHSSASDEVRRALSNDFNRMACAAFESAAGIGKDNALPQSLAWASIRSYYSAFFAAHAIMRIYGWSCTQLETAHTRKIFESANIFGKTGGLTSLGDGLFFLKTDKMCNQVKFLRLKESHKDTWATFLLLLQFIENSIPGSMALSQHKIEAAKIISEIKSIITKNNSLKGNRLSVMRNSINYKLSHGVWFPYSSRAVKNNFLNDISKKWLNNGVESLNDSDEEVESFFIASMKILSLLKELLGVSTDIVPSVDKIFTNGVLKLLNSVQSQQAGG